VIILSVTRIGNIDRTNLNPVKNVSLPKDIKPFSEYLKNAVKETNTLLLESEKLADQFAAGITDNIHEVLIAAEKASIALQFTTQIRNKILDAYNEIMRMQI